MDTVFFKELCFSRLMLGTVQFGLKYGIANKAGLPSYKSAKEIISCAWHGGVNCFDTASSYGQSEEILGRIFTELGIAGKVTVASKIYAMPQDLSPAQAEKNVRKSVIKSLELLHLDALPICMFHREQDYRYMDALVKCRQEGLLRYTGLSVYSPEAAIAAIKDGRIDTLQVPANLLDHRFRKAGIFKFAAERRIAVFVRSVYLQGLLLMPESDIIPELRDVIPVRRKLKEIGLNAGITMKSLAVRYLMGIEGITCLLAGVDSVEQMKENLNLFSDEPLKPEIVEDVERAVPDMPEKILLPYQWTVRMPDTKV